MSDKPNNLNEDDDNIQFDSATNEDHKGSDPPSVNMGTTPLKRLSPRDPRLARFSNREADSSEKAVDDKPATEKFVDQPHIIPLDVLQSIADDKLMSKLPRQSEIAKSSKLVEHPSQTSVTAELGDQSEAEQPQEPADDKPVGKPVTGKLVDQSQEPADKSSDTLNKSKFSELSARDQLLESPDVPEDTSVVTDLSDNSGNLEIETVANTDDTLKSTDVPDKLDGIAFQNPSEDSKPVTYARRSTIGDAQGKTSFLSFNKKKAETSPEKNPDTAILPEKSPAWKKVIDGQTQGTTGTIGEQREVLFVIRGMIERVVMKDNTTATLGRFDTGTVPNEEIDLIPYGAIDRGVSRRHCEILLRDDKLHVVDLGSTNGTFLAGIRLKPNEATLLRKGDELLLGRLAVQVLFR